MDLEAEKLNSKEGKVGNVEMAKEVEHQLGFEGRDLFEKV